MSKDTFPQMPVGLWSYVWTVFCFLLAVGVIPFLIPILLMLRAYRNWLVNRIRHRTSHVNVMSLTDAVWYQNTSRNPGIINGLMWLKGTPDLEKWRNQIDLRMVSATDLNGQLRYPKLTMIPKCVWHRHVWVNFEDFDLHKVVYLYGKDYPQTEQELEVVIGNLCSNEIPKTAAQWEIILIPITYKSQPEYVCMIRMHHAIGDGISIVRMLINNFTNQSAAMVQKKQPQEVKTKERLVTKANVMLLAKAFFTAPENTINRMLTRYQRNALHGPKLSGNQLVTWSKTVKLDLIKQIKNAAGCTVNDILMASLALTFRTYFRSNCCTTPESIRCSIPVNIRKSDPHDTSLDNMFSLVFLDLPLLEEGAKETVMEVKKRMDAIKNSAEPLLNYWSTTYLMSRLPSYLSSLIIDQQCDQCSVVVSNVPGPQAPMIMNDDRVEKAVFWPPQRSDIGMGISLLSYDNSVTMGFMVDKMLMSNPQRLVQMFHDSMHILAKDFGITEAIY